MDRVQVRNRLLEVYYRRLGIVDGLVTTMFYLAFAITDTTLLVVYWDETCKYPLIGWLQVTLIVNTIKYILYCIDRFKGPMGWTLALNAILNFIGVALTLNSTYYLTTLSNCGHYMPEVSRLVFAHTFIDVMLYTIYFCLFVISVCWAPTIIRMMDYVPLPHHIEPVDRGLSQEQIDNLNLQGYEMVPDEEEEICGICLSDYIDGAEIRVLGCKHMYHKECCDAWLKINATCPVCRAEVVVNQAV